MSLAVCRPDILGRIDYDIISVAKLGSKFFCICLIIKATSKNPNLDVILRCSEMKFLCERPFYPQGVRRCVPALRATLPLTRLACLSHFAYILDAELTNFRASASRIAC